MTKWCAARVLFSVFQCCFNPRLWTSPWLNAGNCRKVARAKKIVMKVCSYQLACCNDDLFGISSVRNDLISFFGRLPSEPLEFYLNESGEAEGTFESFGKVRLATVKSRIKAQPLFRSLWKYKPDRKHTRDIPRETYRKRHSSLATVPKTQMNVFHFLKENFDI